MNFYILFLVLIGTCLAKGNLVIPDSHLSAEIHCKYLTINKNYNNSDLFDYILTINDYQITFTPLVVIHQNFDDIPADSILFGLDLSHNHLTDQDLVTFASLNPSLFHQIKYLDLSDNRLTRWETKSFSSQLFTRLQALILDSNTYLKELSFNLINLKMLSMRRCNLASITEFENSNMTNMVFISLADNKITDISNNLNVYNIFNKLIPSSVRIIDLSANKLTRVDTVKYLLQTVNLKKVSFEGNLISYFNAGEFQLTDKKVEIDLRNNLIRNTSIEMFIRGMNLTIQLYGNPLVCDCHSIWLFEEAKKSLYAEQELKKSEKVFKRRKLSYHDQIRLIYRRETEKISPYYSFLNDDSPSHVYLERQKRLRPTAGIIKIKDLTKLKCNFIDVQERTDSDPHMDRIYPIIKSDLLSTQLRKQNFYVKEIKYQEKFIVDSEYEDYMCPYEDHCIESDCNCCVFKHCYCRSICPRQCRCYFDTNLKQNVIDCSSLGLTDVPLEKSESATDMRLSANSFKFLKSHAFFGFVQLKFLYLQDNQISYIAADSFEDLKGSLQMINLAGNSLEFLSGNEFSGLNNLEVLILNENPLKTIENVQFIDSSNLPSLKQLYFYNTKLIIDENKDFLEYSSKYSNASVIFETTTTTIKTTSTTSAKSSTVITITTKTTTAFSPETITIINSSGKNRQVNLIPLTSSTTTTAPEKLQYPGSNLKIQLDNFSSTNRSDLVSKFFNRFKLFNWHYFPALVFLACLFLSFMIVLTVITVARRIETTTSHDQNSKSSKLIGIVDVGGGAFLASRCPSNVNSFDSDNDYDDENSSARLMIVDKYCTCISKNRKSLDSSCEDIYATNQNRKNINYDSSTVAVSRSVANLSLHVYVYYSLTDTDYVNQNLQTVLNRCITLVPDTKYFYKPQSEKYVKLSPESFYELARQTNSSTLVSSSVLNNTCSVLLTDSNSTSVDSSSSSSGSDKGLLLVGRPSVIANTIIANILVVSNSFYGYRPTDSYISLKTKNSYKNPSSVESSASYNLKNKPHVLINSDAYLKASFKIYMNPVEAITNDANLVTSNEQSYIYSTNKTYSLNQKLMKRLLSEPADSKQACRLRNKDDMLSSDAFSDNLQSKLEKYLQSVCLKSSQFSKNNFSYVDYTKR